MKAGFIAGPLHYTELVQVGVLNTLTTDCKINTKVTHKRHLLWTDNWCLPLKLWSTLLKNRQEEEITAYYLFFMYFLCTCHWMYHTVPQITINKVNKTTKKVKEKRDNIKWLWNWLKTLSIFSYPGLHIMPQDKDEWRINN